MRRVSIGLGSCSDYLVLDENEELRDFKFSTMTADRLAGVHTTLVKALSTFSSKVNSSFEQVEILITRACGIHASGLVYSTRQNGQERTPVSGQNQSEL